MFKYVDICFCLFFIVEISMRLWVPGWQPTLALQTSFSLSLSLSLYIYIYMYYYGYCYTRGRGNSGSDWRRVRISQHFRTLNILENGSLCGF